MAADLCDDVRRLILEKADKANEVMLVFVERSEMKIDDKWVSVGRPKIILRRNMLDPLNHIKVSMKKCGCEDVWSSDILCRSHDALKELLELSFDIAHNEKAMIDMNQENEDEDEDEEMHQWTDIYQIFLVHNSSMKDVTTYPCNDIKCNTPFKKETPQGVLLMRWSPGILDDFDVKTVREAYDKMMNKIRILVGEA